MKPIGRSWVLHGEVGDVGDVVTSQATQETTAAPAETWQEVQSWLKACSTVGMFQKPYKSLEKPTKRTH